MNILIEIKDGKKPPSDRKLTVPQIKWHDEWLGQVNIIKSIDEAMALVNYTRRMASPHA